MEKYSYKTGEVIEFLMNNSSYHAIANDGNYAGCEIIYNPSTMIIEWINNGDPVIFNGELILTTWSVENYSVDFLEAINAIRKNKSVYVQVFRDSDNYTKEYKPENDIISFSREEIEDGIWYINAQ